ncbi:MAG: host-nuclease inhibitor Gam family protein [Burkholderiaceae bacterium]
MSAVKAPKVKRPALPTPQDSSEVNDAIHRIGESQRAVQALTTEMNAQLAAIKAEYELRAEPHNEEIKQLADGVHAYCEAHREELTDENKVKYAKFASGEVTWRMTPPKVATKKGISIETIIELLKARKLKRFVRVKEELDKEAILAEPKSIAGMKEIAVVQVEEFTVKPFESEIEAVV